MCVQYDTTDDGKFVIGKVWEKGREGERGGGTEGRREYRQEVNEELDIPSYKMTSDK